ncbi:Uncharacterised protein [Campylobacter hyointestinalis subsp. hyointestinalis]|uniref:Uncharacterized protein n=1 Tax=Campylobacter hyointestinalis subsp. hyointestinalis TaxID=91352 RepID=A0A9W5ES17_CAMHY|nr:Uncharacterised protein [Campylobacter hyointestinalis subsp. hyointestinalis]CUU82986.1 Uncharacterised protein [Campylobacter hyointestinalis subsp. hyointestinalis]CUU88714.1 Uncharacterised protein [Campylobacter hyointestinalis subsp. hyointestinalis]
MYAIAFNLKIDDLKKEIMLSHIIKLMMKLGKN